jgi:hypothetical protein
LQNVANSLAQNFGNEYYGALAHTIANQVNQPVQVSGHAGWEVTYQVTYTNAAAQGATWTEEEAAVVVIDTGTGNEPAVFFTSVPQNLDENNVSTLVSSLQVAAPITPSGAPTSQAPSDQASDGAPAPTGGSNP